METRHESEMRKEKKPLKVEVKLLDENSNVTRSKFYFDGKFMGYGLEDEYRAVKVKGETRIDNGEYKFGFRYSPKFSKEYYRDDNYNIILASKRTTEALKKQYHTQHEMIWVLDVPKFEYILWHWLNYEDQTDGCYGVGSSVFEHKTKGLAIGGSRDKYEEIYPILMRAIKSRGAYVIYDR